MGTTVRITLITYYIFLVFYILLLLLYYAYILYNTQGDCKNYRHPNRSGSKREAKEP